MNIQNIQTFLCVVRNQSLSSASSLLYISQSAVTLRLQQLEEELGTTLIVRKKGIRNIELTPQGVAFVPLAERWISLNAETENFSAQFFLTPFAVASLDSLNRYLFQSIYKKLADTQYALALQIRTHNSNEIFSLVDAREVDVGFAFHISRSSNVSCRALFSEKVVLVCSKFGEWGSAPISIDDLDPRFEVFVSWSPEFQLWHDSLWGQAHIPSIHLDSAVLIPLYMDNPKRWSFCPISVAKSLIQEGAPIEIHEQAQTPPNRICYYLTNRAPQSKVASEARKLFQKELYEGLVAQSSIIELESDAEKTLLGL